MLVRCQSLSLEIMSRKINRENRHILSKNDTEVIKNTKMNQLTLKLFLIRDLKFKKKIET